MHKKLAILLVLLLAAAGCSKEEAFPPIAADVPFAATLNIRDSSLTFLDENGDRLADWKLDSLYTGGKLLGDGKTLLLYGTELEQADLYSLKEGRKIGEFKTGKGIVNGIYLEKQDLYVFADKRKNEVRFFDKDGEQTAKIRTASYPMDLAIDGRMLYVAAYKGGRLEAIDLEKMKVTASAPIEPSPAGMLLRPEDGEVWIGGHGSGDKPQSSVHIYSLDRLALKSKVSAPLMPVNFIENDQGIYVLSHGTNMLYHFDGEGGLIGSLEVGANPFALGFLGRYVVAAGFDSDELYWIDAEKMRLRRQVKVGKGPFIIFVREKVE